MLSNMITHFKHIYMVAGLEIWGREGGVLNWHFIFYLSLLVCLLLTPILSSYLNSAVFPDLSGLRMCFVLSGHGSLFSFSGGHFYFAFSLHMLTMNILPLHAFELCRVMNVKNCPEWHKHTLVVVRRLKTAPSWAHLTRKPGFTLHYLSAGYEYPLGYHPTEDFH